ncbi:MAG: RDD family protein [Chloroflexus sp.]|uniref:RDD family protein n=1 Tax=Chloroflexus sp. TaxID=1904827 RepID=UPI00404B35CA
MNETPSWHEPYPVVTPEGVQVVYMAAGLASRSLAAVVDYVIIITLLATSLVMVAINEGTSSVNQDVILALLAMLVFVVNWGYLVFFEWIWNGQTPGKRLVRLRILREGGRPLDIADIVVRNLMRAIDFLPLLYGIGLVTMFVDRYHLRLGDLTASTVVVHEAMPLTLERVMQPVVVQVPPRAPDAPPTPFVPNVERLTAADLALLLEFLRRNELQTKVRSDPAAHLAAALRQRLALPLSSGDPERFIEHVLREYHVAQAVISRQDG